MINAQRIDDLTEIDYRRRKLVKKASKILSNNIWFEYSNAIDIFENLNKYFIRICNCFKDSKACNEKIPSIFLLLGDINTGKTSLITRYMEYYKIVKNKINTTFSDDDIRYFELPIKFTLKKFFSLLLEKFGIVIRGSALKNLDNELLLNRIINELKNREVKYLIFDDIVNIIKINNGELNQILKAIKKITIQVPTCFIFIGSSIEVDFIMKFFDPKVFFEIYLFPLKYNEEYFDLLYSLYESYKKFLPEWNLVDNNGYINEKIAAYLYGLSRGRIGALIQTINNAAIYALMQNKLNISIQDYEVVQPIKYIVKNGKLLQELKSKKLRDFD